MQTLTLKKYNEQQTSKWNSDWHKALAEGRDHTCLPQLAFYVFEKTYGYVAFEANSAYWAKTKKEAIINFNKAKEYYETKKV